MLHLCTFLGQEVILLCSLGAISSQCASFMLEVAQEVPHWVPIVVIKSFHHFNFRPYFMLMKRDETTQRSFGRKILTLH